MNATSMIAAIYARKSTDQIGADEARSVTRQIEHARAFARGKGWMVSGAHVYVDDGISGAEFDRRPAFLRLMNALRPKPPFDVLIMSEESRLGREAIETAYALKQLIQAGVRVWFYLENRERTLDSPTDKLLLSLTTFADELERELSDLQATLLLDHVLADLGPAIYNQAAADARAYLEERAADLEAALHKAEFPRSGRRPR